IGGAAFCEPRTLLALSRLRLRKRLLDRHHQIGGVPKALQIASPRFQLRPEIAAAVLNSYSGANDIAYVGIGTVAELIGVADKIGDLREHQIRSAAKCRSQRRSWRRVEFGDVSRRVAGQDFAIEVLDQSSIAIGARCDDLAAFLANVLIRVVHAT